MPHIEHDGAFIYAREAVYNWSIGTERLYITGTITGGVDVRSYDLSGAPDTAFGDAGTVRLERNNYGRLCVVRRPLPQADGRLPVRLSSDYSAREFVALTRTGIVDAAIFDNGKRTISSRYEEGSSVVAMPDGHGLIAAIPSGRPAGSLPR